MVQLMKEIRQLALLFTLVALMPCGTPAQTNAAPAAEIVARVNDQVITLAEYQKAEQQLRVEATNDCQACSPEKIEAQFKAQQKDLLRGLIDQVLMAQRAKDMGITVESDLNKRLDEIRQQNGLATLADLQKGDAVMIVATEGTQERGVIAITLLAGVEPLLQAAGASTILTPWTMGAAPGGDAAP